MKFLAFTDLHEDRKAIKDLVKRSREDDIEFMVCLGDISNFGRGLRYLLKEFNKVGKKMLVIPGNHEEGSVKYAELCGEFEHVVNLDRNSTEIDGYVFLGYGGDGFRQTDREFRRVSRKWYSKFNGKKVVLLTHGPPFDTKLDKLSTGHVGSVDYRKFIERIKPKLALSGHLHETVGEMDVIGSTKLVNPGWDGMVIELK